MSLLITLLIGLGISAGLFTLYWVIQYLIGNSAIVDVFWAASVAIVGVFFCVVTPGEINRRWIAAILISLWAARLSFYLFRRWASHEEDPRYTALKTKWGKNAQLRMLRFFQMQGLGAYLFALPLVAVGYTTAPLGLFDWIGITVWAVSIGGEALSDYQLAEFKKSPGNKGEVCNVGLWKYSRHPNYFFEWLHWWTYVFLGITHSYGWLSILAPVAMWFFLNRVTGIPHTEAQAIRSRGDKYRRYQQTTSAFFPWFPKQVPN